ncbi:MAG TPA: A/G-specific adenine glycosylase [Candidatus Latescibacteria bacterium]|jgi:A/G-specific adenine glycosylase|nr:A/G-specific adenine glycosylase [Gemmatimonadaceae bacterium]MDP6016694.1 A/G-specific adenine glycosylase [Candidatus Latescibacterota bacterium]HJP32077.1 A/G-specific adenine glycosylase [Candidatus Latescibacterota bacterium]
MSQPPAAWIEDGRHRSVFRRNLLRWYGKHRRDLPWRRTDDPYAVWLSEVMLQQTRVETARGYYERFLERFPTVTALAVAKEAEVLKAWEGLGYYSRARHLHQAARAVVEDHDGDLPDTYDGLIGLPGVGPYTAAAVSSIVFDRPHPALDGNMMRVFSRLLRLEGDPRRASVRSQMVRHGEALMPPRRSSSRSTSTGAGDLNQALMELGARICLPAQPRCGDCPVTDWCRARAELEDPSVLPTRPQRRKRPHLQVTAGIIRRRGKVLIAQRPPGGMLAGLWEFPGGKQEAGESLAECLAREIREELGCTIDVEEEVASVDHEYTHLSITLHAFAARYRSGRVRALGCSAFEWIDADRLHDFAIPRADHRVLEALTATGTSLQDLIRKE